MGRIILIPLWAKMDNRRGGNMRTLATAILLLSLGMTNLVMLLLMLVMERVSVYESNLIILYGEIALFVGITLFAIYNFYKELKSRQRHSADKE